MKYRVKETAITPTHSEYKIQRRIFFMWFDVDVNPKYECSLLAAQRWVKLKERGYPVEKYFYE